VEGVVGWPVEDRDVDFVRGRGGAPVPCGNEFGLALVVFFGGAERAGLGPEESGLSVVDGFAVDGYPFAYLLQAFDLGGGNYAVGIGTDVEQVVAAFAGDVDKIAEQGLGGFEVSVEGLVTPGVVHGHAGLPVFAGITGGGDVLLGGLGIALVASAEAVVPDEIGMLIEEFDDLSGEGGRHVLGGGIEPDDDGVVAVVGEQLLELRDALGVEIGGEVAVLGGVPVEGGGFVVAGLVGSAAGSGPVLILRVVEA
jgi:hypothetical protein